MGHPFESALLGPIIDVRVREDLTDKKRCYYRTQFRTVVLTAQNQFFPILDGPDPTREYVVVIAIDVPVVLTRTQGDAQHPDNLATGLTTPRGSIIPINQAIPFPSGDQLFASAPISGAATARVSIISVHRNEMPS